MHVFYSDSVSGNQLVLSAEESVHALRVLRIQPGDTAEILNGKGQRFSARFEGAQSKQCFFSVLKTEDVPARSVHLTMAIAPPKSIDRFEWFLEKATEIGVERIVPVISRHSERKVVKTDRSRKILIAAMKQSRNTWLPEISEPISLSAYLKTQSNPEAKRYIAHCHSNSLPHLAQEPAANHVEILIGPEGDFDTEEVKTAVASSWKEISLSENRLRTETAALVAVHLIALKNL